MTTPDTIEAQIATSALIAWPKFGFLVQFDSLFVNVSICFVFELLLICELIKTVAQLNKNN